LAIATPGSVATISKIDRGLIAGPYWRCSVTLLFVGFSFLGLSGPAFAVRRGHLPGSNLAIRLSASDFPAKAAHSLDVIGEFAHDACSSSLTMNAAEVTATRDRASLVDCAERNAT
jgi:hypothetical protein